MPNSILNDVIFYLRKNSIDEQELFNNTTYNEDIFGNVEEAKQWWAKVKTNTTGEYKEKLGEYKEKIIKNLEYDNLEYDEDNNYFKNLIKLIDIQRIIGTIRLGTSMTDSSVIYTALANKKSTIPLTSTVKTFVYNDEYKKILKNKEQSPSMPSVGKELISTGGLNRNKYFKKQTRRKYQKKTRKTTKLKGYKSRKTRKSKKNGKKN